MSYYLCYEFIFFKKQEEHIRHFQRANKVAKAVNLFLPLIASSFLLILLVLPFGPLVPAFVGLVNFLGVSSILLRVFLVVFTLCVWATPPTIRTEERENIKFQLAFREIEYGRCKTKLPKFMKEKFDVPQLKMSQVAAIQVSDMNDCFGNIKEASK